MASLYIISPEANPNPNPNQKSNEYLSHEVVALGFTASPLKTKKLPFCVCPFLDLAQAFPA